MITEAGLIILDHKVTLRMKDMNGRANQKKSTSWYNTSLEPLGLKLLIICYLDSGLK